jgi:hypothetical protein
MMTKEELTEDARKQTERYAMLDAGRKLKVDAFFSSPIGELNACLGMVSPSRGAWTMAREKSQLWYYEIIDDCLTCDLQSVPVKDLWALPDGHTVFSFKRNYGYSGARFVIERRTQ